jgi:hypothetical protein
MCAAFLALVGASSYPPNDDHVLVLVLVVIIDLVGMLKVNLAVTMWSLYLSTGFEIRRHDLVRKHSSVVEKYQVRYTHHKTHRGEEYRSSSHRTTITRTTSTEIEDACTTREGRRARGEAVLICLHTPVVQCIRAPTEDLLVALRPFLSPPS